MNENTKFTQYASDYLAGYNNIPIGILDNPEFKREVVRLSGYTPPTPEQILAHNKRINGNIVRIEKMIKPLLGVKGGKPKSGKSLSDYKNLMFNLDMLKGCLYE